MLFPTTTLNVAYNPPNLTSTAYLTISVSDPQPYLEVIPPGAPGALAPFTCSNVNKGNSAAYSTVEYYSDISDNRSAAGLLSSVDAEITGQFFPGSLPNVCKIQFELVYTVTGAAPYKILQQQTVTVNLSGGS
jgi:hypothetical protein